MPSKIISSGIIMGVGKTSDMLFISSLIERENPMFTTLELTKRQDPLAIRHQGKQYIQANETGGTASAIFSSNLFASPTINVTIKKCFPDAVLLRTRLILQLIYEKQRTEGVVVIVLSSENGTDESWKVIIPHQEDTGSEVNIAKEELAKIAKEGTIVATIHSHPFGSNHGFLSATDHAFAACIPEALFISLTFNPARQQGIYSFGELTALYGDLSIPRELLASNNFPDICELNLDQENPEIKELLAIINERVKIKKPPAIGKSGYWREGFSSKSPTQNRASAHVPFWQQRPVQTNFANLESSDARMREEDFSYLEEDFQESVSEEELNELLPLGKW